MNHEEVLMHAQRKPQSLAIPYFPMLSKNTSGIGGVWVIGGETTVGKTTFARHLAYSMVAPDLNVAYLDTEGHFLNDAANRGIMACHGPELRPLARDYMAVFQRSDEFYAHLQHLPARTLIVIDHIQLEAERRGGVRTESIKSLDTEMAKAVDWANDGHIVLILSQFARASYGSSHPPTKSSFKGSSAIEHGAQIGSCLWRPDKENPNLIQFRVVKPRFIPQPTEAVNLVRDGWCLKESRLVAMDGSEASEPKEKSFDFDPVIEQVYKQPGLGPVEIRKAIPGRKRPSLSTVERRLRDAVGKQVKNEKGRYYPL